MKITVKKSVEQEIESPELPFYLKDNWCAYKIINKKTCIAIKNFANDNSIHKNYPASIPLELFDECQIISREEFLDFYNSITRNIESEL